MIRPLLSTAIFIWLHAFVAHAQVEKTFFQTYDIKDGVRRIYLQSFDEYELRSWNGVQLMIETTVRLDGGNMDLLGIIIKDGHFNFYIEEGSIRIRNPIAVWFRQRRGSADSKPFWPFIFEVESDRYSCDRGLRSRQESKCQQIGLLIAHLNTTGHGQLTVTLQ